MDGDGRIEGGGEGWRDGREGWRDGKGGRTGCVDEKLLYRKNSVTPHRGILVC